uniref:Uncharacterized protein n=1 Tax=Meloidogyne incognita TaxID=6306 RepID=A0A914LZB8_MELIC
MAENRATVEHNGFEYYKEGDQWYQTSTFFKDNFPIKEDKVPDEVKTRWSELVPEEREENQEETEEAQEVSERATSELPKSQPSKSLSKKSVKNKKRIIPPVDPRLSRERDRSMPAPKKAFSSVNFTSTSSAASSSKTAETVEKGSQPIIVTDSLQLIRPLRAELKWKMRTNAIELEKRMEIRKSIMNNSDDRIKPFEPKKKTSEESLASRNESRIQMNVKAEELISKLERIKRKREQLNNRIRGDEEINPPVKVPRGGNFFDIERLADVAAEHNVTVLNLDKFICATDKRKIIYNDRGVCIFCDVHGERQLSDKHENDKDCPFFFCTCANCYLVGKLGEAGRFLENK